MLTSSLVLLALIAFGVVLALQSVGQPSSTQSDTAKSLDETIAYIKDNRSDQLAAYTLNEPMSGYVFSGQIDDMKYPVTVYDASGLIYMPPDMNKTIDTALLADESKGLFESLGYEAYAFKDGSDGYGYMNGSVLCKVRIQAEPPQVAEYSCLEKVKLTDTYAIIESLIALPQSQAVLADGSIKNASLTISDAEGVSGARVNLGTSDSNGENQQGIQLFFVKMPDSDWSYVTSIQNNTKQASDGKSGAPLSDDVKKQLNKPEWNGALMKLIGEKV